LSQHPISSRHLAAASIFKSKKEWRCMLAESRLLSKAAATDVVQSPLLLLKFFYAFL
jgi:hypothetical protein